MAIISTHTLNSVDGSHAANVGLQLAQINPDGTRQILLDSETDGDGRFTTMLRVITPADKEASYEMVLKSGAYFAGLGFEADTQTVQEVVMRFRILEGQHRYHMPFMLAPHSYSVWWGG